MRLLFFLLLGFFNGMASAQSARPTCADVFEALDSRIQQTITEDQQLTALDLISHETVIHYTTLAGLRGILRSHRIIADAKHRVFLTHEAFSADDAHTVLFINSTKAVEHGHYAVILRRPQGVELANSPQNPFELVHHGSYRFTDADILYVGVNPFF